MKKNKKKKTLVQALLENEIWNFWADGWRKKITVQWNGDLKKLKPFRRKIGQLLGKDWGYERSVSGALGLSGKPDLVITRSKK